LLVSNRSVIVPSRRLTYRTSLPFTTDREHRMSKLVKIGMVGTSWWADSMYMPALSKHPDAEVCAIVGRNLDHAREFAEQWRIPNVYTSLEEMLDKEALDAILIVSSNKHHYPMAMTAIERGLHVLCEKPLGMNYTEAS